MRAFIYLFVYLFLYLFRQCLQTTAKRRRQKCSAVLTSNNTFNRTVTAGEPLKVAWVNWESSVCCNYTVEDSPELSVLVDFTWCYKDTKRVIPDIGYRCNLVQSGSDFDLIHRHQYSIKYYKTCQSEQPLRTEFLKYRVRQTYANQWAIFNVTAHLRNESHALIESEELNLCVTGAQFSWSFMEFEGALPYAQTDECSTHPSTAFLYAPRELLSFSPR